jgi:hypothetical protein
MKFFLLLFICSYLPESYAQLATSSFFGQTKSRNPGVLNKRRAGFLAVGADKQEFNKTQSFSDAQVQGNQGGTSTQDTVLNNVKFFRGGRGGALTTEFGVMKSVGTKTENIKLNDNSLTTVESEADVTFIDYQIGLSTIGLGFSLYNYDYSNNYNVNLDSTSYSNNFDATISGLMTSFGWAGSIGNMKLGLLSRLMRINIESKGQKTEENQNNSAMGVLIGAGIGIETNSFHMELGIEKPLVDEKPPENAIDVNREPQMRISGVIEMKRGGFAFGYQGIYFSGEFGDPENTAENQLVFVEPKNRLINQINIAFGASKGLSLSGSFSSSKSEELEKVPFFGEAKVPTQVTVKKVSVEISYVF